MFTKRALVGLILALGAAWSLFDVWSKSQPILVVDALSDRMQCVSYAPYRRPDQTPLDLNAFIAPEQIEADMALLAKRFDCVRIYSVSQGLQAVPEAAARHGLKVLLGIWIGPTRADNEIELIRAIALAKAHPQAIKAVIVGNEVLLRSDQPVEILREYLHRVKAALPQSAVTYADVWEFWLQHRELRDAVDFVTIHILPYWEDRPIPVVDAVGHVSHIYQHVVHELAGKSVMIGETGWPSQGRRRLGAAPGLVNQARFIREFSVRADLEKIPYNVIEAFDQPWKRRLEGAAGGYWGLYDSSGQAKFPFRGPVAEAPAIVGFSVAIATGFFAVWGWCRRRQWHADASLAMLALSVVAGDSVANVALHMTVSNRDTLEWTVTALYAGVQILSLVYLGSALIAWCAEGKEPTVIPAASQVLRWLRRNDQSFSGSARMLGTLRLLLLFGAAFVCLLLFFDPRYRDFPTAFYLPGAIGFGLLAWNGARAKLDLEEIFLATVVAIFAVFDVLNEHLITPRHEPWHWADALNPDALLWGLCCLVLAGPVLVPVLLELRTRQSQTA